MRVSRFLDDHVKSLGFKWYATTEGSRLFPQADIALKGMSNLLKILSVFKNVVG